MKTNEFIKILEKYSSGQNTEEEKIFINKYFDRKYLQHHPLANPTTKEVKPYIYERIEASILDLKGKKSSQRFTYIAAIAASILLILGLFVFFGYKPEPNSIIITTEYGQKDQVRLPDGSLVTLNSGSIIQFPKEFDADLREVVLKGEAFFIVQRDTTRPFVVETQDLTIEVLGTSFNINAFSDRDSIAVSVASGKVLVKNRKELREVLFPDHQLHYHKITQEYRKSSNETSIDAAWIFNTIHLNNKTFEETVSMIEKWFNVSIEITDSSLAQKRLQGKYHNPTLEETLESLGFLLNVQFIEKSPSNYFVKPLTPMPM